MATVARADDLEKIRATQYDTIFALQESLQSSELEVESHKITAEECRSSLTDVEMELQETQGQPSSILQSEHVKPN